MLVAEKRQYAEAYYPHALEKEQPTSVPRSRVAPKAKSKPQKKALHLALVLTAFALCSYTVARFAMISQNQQEILELEKALEKQQSIQEYLKLELAAQGDLQKIEEFAKNDLEMDYPDKEQVLFVELPEKTTKDSAEIAKETENKESLWSKIIGLLD